MFNLKSVEVSEGSKYLGAGVHKVKVVSWEDKGDFVEYVLKNKSGEKGIRFYKVKDTDKDIVKEIKAKQLKGFLLDCGVSNFSSDQAAIASAVDAVVNVILRDREYWTNDRDTGMPVIKTATEYFSSRKPEVSVEFKDSFNKPLSEEDKAAYEAALAAHNGMQTAKTVEDNLPF